MSVQFGTGTSGDKRARDGEEEDPSPEEDEDTSLVFPSRDGVPDAVSSVLLAVNEQFADFHPDISSYFQAFSDAGIFAFKNGTSDGAGFVDYDRKFEIKVHILERDHRGNPGRAMAAIGPFRKINFSGFAYDTSGSSWGVVNRSAPFDLSVDTAAFADKVIAWFLALKGRNGAVPSLKDVVRT